MTHEDQVFITTMVVIVIDPTRKMVALSVISWLTSVVAKLNAIAKVHKYKRFHEEHHFTLMTMEVHGEPRCDMDCFIRECVCLFHNKQSKGHLSLFFCNQFFTQCVSIVL
jgi:hypothetical protein